VVKKAVSSVPAASRSSAAGSAKRTRSTSRTRLDDDGHRGDARSLRRSSSHGGKVSRALSSAVSGPATSSSASSVATVVAGQESSGVRTLAHASFHEPVVRFDAPNRAPVHPRLDARRSRPTAAGNAPISTTSRCKSSSKMFRPGQTT